MTPNTVTLDSLTPRLASTLDFLTPAQPKDHHHSTSILARQTTPFIINFLSSREP